MIDPDCHLVRYIGKTTDPYKRENEHKNRKGRADKDKWIESLKEQGKKPIFHILEICDDTNWHKRERFYIDKYDTPESPLLNMRYGVTYRPQDIEELLLKGVFYKCYFKKRPELFYVVIGLENGDFYRVCGIKSDLGYYYIKWLNFYGHMIPRESLIYKIDLSTLPELPDDPYRNILGM